MSKIQDKTELKSHMNQPKTAHWLLRQTEPEKRLFLEKEFYDQRLKNRQVKHIFAIT